MAIWMLTKGGAPVVKDKNTFTFDDGGQAAPGEEGFSRDAVNDFVRQQGSAADGANYMGPSAPPPEPEEPPQE